MQETTEQKNGFNFVYFWINKDQYARRDIGSVLPANKSQKVTRRKSFLAGSLLPPDKVRRWVGSSCSWVAGLSARSTVLWRGLVSYEQSWSSVGNAGLVCLWCGLIWRQRSLILSDIRRVTVLSARSPWSRLSFLNTFVDRFIATFRFESASKKFWGKVHFWLNKGSF